MSILGPPKDSFEDIRVKISKLALRLNDMNEGINWQEVSDIANGFVVKGDELRRLASTEKLIKIVKEKT